MTSAESNGGQPAAALRSERWFGGDDINGFNHRAAVGGVVVDPGDLVVGDVDGIVVIPSGLAEEVVAAVASKRRLGQAARDDLMAGLGIRAVWDKYEVF